MRAKLIEIAGGLLVGLALLAASVGVTVVMGRLIEVEAEVEAEAEVEVRANASASQPANGEVAR